MPAENVHHRKGRKKYTLVLIPGDEAQKTRSVSVDRFGAAALVLVLFFAIIAVGVVAIVYTPVGNLVPIPAPKLEQTYGRQIAQIQEQVKLLTREMTLLQQYNLRLREALGEKTTRGDSVPGPGRGAADAGMPPALQPDDGQGLQPPQAGTMTVTGREILSSPQIGVVASGMEQTRNLEQRDLLPLTMPADGYLTRGFDVQHEHYGIDIAGKPGTAIFAAADGSVMFAGWTYEDGFMMIIGHSQGYMTVYKHTQALLKSTAEKVRRGEPIALLGNTGTTSAGSHLHFELWKDGIVCDPDNYLLIPQ